MKSILFAVFGILSFVIGVYCFVWALRVHKRGAGTKRVLSAMHLYTIGVFVSVLLVFIPIYYTDYDFGDSWILLRPLLIAAHNSLRVFILDGDFDIIVKALEGENDFLRIAFSLHTAFLYVIAPVLTFSNVLSLFQNVQGEIRYKWHRNKKYYILSELNEKSIALATSIYKKQKKAIVIFTDVFEQNEEKDYELLLKAQDIRAICLKKDIAHLDLLSHKGAVEIFLIGKDESENISQAVRITNELNKSNSKYNVKVFVFSSKPSASYIIDSIRYDNLLEHASMHDYGEDCFKLRRIDERQQLIWNTLPKMRLFELAQANNKTLSVMIVGFGSYGMELFKALVWYCQFEGYKLEINILDKQSGYVKPLIQRSCPELVTKKFQETIGEAQYDIEILDGVDVLTSDMDDLLRDGGKWGEAIAQRLKKTNLAFVSLGDDDTNIEVSIYLRSLFDRIKGVKAEENIGWKDEVVDIYSVVFDDHKSRILYNENAKDTGAHLLVNHKDIPYHIHFIGGMYSQFDYENIYDGELEQRAYGHHRNWVDIEIKILAEWQKDGVQWQEKGVSKDIAKELQWLEKEKEQEAVIQSRKKYEQHEYYRRSSMAKEIYQREIRSNPALLAATTCKEQNRQTCECENCLRRKRSEHMRWNAYTRSVGYIYDANVRADRALQHTSLCGWDELSPKDKMKD